MTKSISIFAFDICEISQIRRIESFIRLGVNLTSFSMRRRNMNIDFEPSWPNIHLFYTENEKPIRRIFTIIRSWIKLCFHLKTLAKSEIIIARNFDMLLIALGAKLMLHIFGLRKNVELVYECLDIHSYFCSPGVWGMVSRYIERIALKFTNRITVSSPAFQQKYFQEIQNYDCEIIIIENKLITTLKKQPIKAKTLKTPIKIGLVGSIRCAPSVELLINLARAYPTSVEIHFHGIVHTHSIPNIERDVIGLKNVHLHGAYDYYSDLEKIYHNLNFVWAQDLWQRNGNSMWLLPNRIYEAGYFGCPSIALSYSETGQKISDMGWGLCIDKIDVETVATTVHGINKSDYQILCQNISDTPKDEFVQNDNDLLAVFGNAEEMA